MRLRSREVLTLSRDLALVLAWQRSVWIMGVTRTFRTPDRQWLVDDIIDEPGVQHRLWDAEGLPIGEAANLTELVALLARLGIDPDALEQVPSDDPWCE